MLESHGFYINKFFGKFSYFCAINANEVEVQFSQEVDPTSVTVNNFDVLDNSYNNIAVDSAVYNSEENSVKLTLSSDLDTTNAPYTVYPDSEAFGIDEGFEIDIPSEAPTVENVNVTAGDAATVEADIDLADKSASAGLVNSVTDVTDTTNTASVAGTTAVTSGNLELDVDNSSFFQGGHTYEVEIAAGTMEDAFGNTNDEAVTYQFSVESNEEAPSIADLEYLASEKVSGQVNAVVTFNQAVEAAGDSSVDLDIINKQNYTTTPEAGLSAHFHGEDVTDEHPDLELDNNQILIENVNNNVSMEDQNYTLRLAAGEVQDTTLDEVQNEVTEAEAQAVDVIAPEVTEVTLQSSESVELNFSEAVTHDTSKNVLVDGFDENGDAVNGADNGIEASVEMSSDGQSAVLTPVNDGELFITGDNGQAEAIEAEAGAFVDGNDNQIADTNIDASASKVTDEAAPVSTKAVANATNDISVSFTENVSAVGSDQPSVTVNGVEYSYDDTSSAGSVAGWQAPDTLNIYDDGSAFNATDGGDSVVVPSSAVTDGEETNETISITTTP
ncbi:hypothetical protein [Salibacterium qingdaonense]|uniref:Uncharacterized protein n=1 Tax=Salibacterium qingdaonense TaxID=266892 RepID=A0A1I4NKD2_9BACI|nr:hypothetical protein [Salibacterium qingdaonense]SFM15767.1 hypothetical protein SAMN04488054_11857 [Salibacterium qingdaonense]